MKNSEMIKGTMSIVANSTFLGAAAQQVATTLNILQQLLTAVEQAEVSSEQTEETTGA
jgi:hypothetical protein